ncbi:MAG: ABC transporter ATP-binding protein, partial [bacterium]
VYKTGVFRKAQVKALDGVSLEVEGGMFGLLGPNGAGKTTLMRICATLLEPTAGEVTFEGINVVREPEAIRGMLGYLPQEFGVYPGWTLYEFLDYLALIRGLVNNRRRKEEVERVMGLANLTEYARRKLKTFSGGMKQRFGIAQALLGDPKLLIVDEPTSGLDPEERNRFRNLLSDISKGKVVLLSTHIVEDISQACPKLAIIDKGLIKVMESPRALIDSVEGKVFEVETNEDGYHHLKSKYKVSNVVREDGRVRVKVLSDGAPPNVDAKPVVPSLEDAYLWHVGHTGV